MIKPFEENSFLYGANGDFIAELYQTYLENPLLVSEEWQSFFKDLGDNLDQARQDWQGPSWGSAMPLEGELDAPSNKPVAKDTKATKSNVDGVAQETLDAIRALMLIRAYRVRGHLEANLDPLKIAEQSPHPELNPAHYGFTEDDWDHPIFVDGRLGMQFATLREIYAALRATYCNTVGVEFMHMQDPDKKDWVQFKIEGEHDKRTHTAAEQKILLDLLTQATVFEEYLDSKYKGAKRFGLDGGESTVPALEQLIFTSSQLGVEQVIIGMAHRGRLNVLANTMKKPMEMMFAEFQGEFIMPEEAQGSGDVKYHLGTSADRMFGDKKVHLSLTANPSHLEAVDPVVLGKVRAKQDMIGDTERAKVMGVLLHGDAAFAGQGLVSETLDLSDLDGYKTGGTIHIIINNQIGFTTSPTFSRSSPYCSDSAKAIQAPIFHVNGDDPDAVAYVAGGGVSFAV